MMRWPCFFGCVFQGLPFGESCGFEVRVQRRDYGLFVVSFERDDPWLFERGLLLPFCASFEQVLLALC